ncbi:4-(cytidine 5'-diphospho)-2-C-methyl-D-erythritol kinase [Candidatus Peregrinibacteria bacterium]|jgi:4-diphosphocytidyl-2-C-methyl-D-erythritol kinase|nr:4-(cytidine 5'-diphospho)-2-C-methyl-D-erythritol kinase [Candidatus Peregrinibacteria bacterium]MBT4055844.1 4-(cytidine 5'-diphospho)-2-C-methyl-D-erythritol kinase [Candidatus Peregrinibacteria bacterium]
MNKLTLQSNAKVNLSLDIIGVEKAAGPFEGYHFIQTVLCEITPQNCSNFKPDFVTIEEVSKDKFPESHDDKNLAYKALEIVKKHVGETHPPIKITIEKNIPISSGLGGGSSNAATVIKGLNHMWELHLTAEEMRKMVAEIGMDVPFFISGDIALAEHYGEQITQLPPVHGLAFTLFPDSASDDPEKTKNAYAALDLSKCGKNVAQTEALIHAIKTNDLYEIHQNLHNDFETSLREHEGGTGSPPKTPHFRENVPEVPPKHPASGKHHQQNHHLTGAGPTTFILA